MRLAVALHRARIEIGQQLANAGVQRPLREKEGLVAQARQDPTLGDLHGDFDFAFVALLYGPKLGGRARPLPDPTWIHTKLRRTDVTLELLHLECLQRIRTATAILSSAGTLLDRVVGQPFQRLNVSSMAVGRLRTETTAPALIPRAARRVAVAALQPRFQSRISRMCRMGSRSAPSPVSANLRSANGRR